MITNVVLEALIGSIPVFGDIFHVAWKANRRNYRLLMREENRALGANHARHDLLFFALLLAAAVCLVAVPVGLIIWLIRSHPLSFSYP
jgi:hypothetical protein